MISDASVVCEVDGPLKKGGYFKVHIKTNAGDRFVTARSVKVLNHQVGA
ncbi:MAG: hypothetical protein OET90_08980 [Desulfuromonadales bacterium]|nr:hypothetical protein [Desulfuromonadales bacterium]